MCIYCLLYVMDVGMLYYVLKQSHTNDLMPLLKVAHLSCSLSTLCDCLGNRLASHLRLRDCIGMPYFSSMYTQAAPGSYGTDGPPSQSISSSV